MRDLQNCYEKKSPTLFSPDVLNRPVVARDVLRVKGVIFLMDKYKYEYYSQKTYSTNTNMHITLGILCHKYE